MTGNPQNITHSDPSITHCHVTIHYVLMESTLHLQPIRGFRNSRKSHWPNDGINVYFCYKCKSYTRHGTDLGANKIHKRSNIYNMKGMRKLCSPIYDFISYLLYLAHSLKLYTCTGTATNEGSLWLNMWLSWFIMG